jgi:hypothetical protein
LRGSGGLFCKFTGYVFLFELLVLDGTISFLLFIVLFQLYFGSSPFIGGLNLNRGNYQCYGGNFKKAVKVFSILPGNEKQKNSKPIYRLFFSTV